MIIFMVFFLYLDLKAQCRVMARHLLEEAAVPNCPFLERVKSHKRQLDITCCLGGYTVYLSKK